MLEAALSRLGQSLVVLVLLSIVSFGLVLLSGDPVSMMLPLHATAQDRANLEHELGLDQPVAVQYVEFLGSVAHGDLGRSLVPSTCFPLIVAKLPATAILALTACVLAIGVGLPLGIIAGYRPNSAWDVVAAVLALGSISIPSFWLGLILILFVGDYLRLLPVSGTGDVQHLIFSRSPLRYRAWA